MRQMVMTGLWETFWYLCAGGLLTGVAFVVMALVLSPLTLRIGTTRALLLLRRGALFAALLYLWGAPGNLAFTLAMRDRYYFAADPVVDWLPWLPVPSWPLDTACGGHYLNGASAPTMLIAWCLVAIPVWAAAILSFRLVIRRPRLNV